MKMFSIRDKKAEGFNTPFFQPTFGLAERAFKDACQDEKSTLAKHPEDFALYYHGEFDQNLGLLKVEDEPKKICDANV